MSNEAHRSKSNFTIKELLRQDQDAGLIEMAEAHCSDTGTREEWDFDRCSETCRLYREGLWVGRMVIFIAYLGDEPVGYTIGDVGQALHKKTIIGEQKLLYVVPRLRGTLLAVRLLQRFEQWARDHGATQIFTGTVNELYAERTSQFLEKLGHRRVGYLHVKEI